MRGPRLFSGPKINNFQCCGPVNFAPSLREGAKFIGSHQGRSDMGKIYEEKISDGANTFPGEKNGGVETFQKKKMTGLALFMRKK